jgi:hypothetical protein
MNDDETTRFLNQLTEWVPDSPDAASRIITLGRATRRRRHNYLAIGAAAAVLAVVAGGEALTNTGSQPPPAHGPANTSGPNASQSPTPSPESDGACFSEAPFHAETPQIDNLAEQKAVVTELVGVVRNGYTVTYAEPTVRGVVVLVRGDVEAARRDLLANPLVVHVNQHWDSMTGPDLVQAVGQDAVTGAVAEVRRVARGHEGFTNVHVWPDGVSVQVFWKRGEVPDEIQTLVGTDENGVRIDPIVEVDYSSQELARAQRTLWDLPKNDPALPAPRVSSACRDYSGIGAEVSHSDLRTWKPREDELSEMVGVPVHLRYGNAPIGLLG